MSLELQNQLQINIQNTLTEYLTLSSILTSANASIRHSTTSVCPFHEAQWRLLLPCYT